MRKLAEEGADIATIELLIRELIEKSDAVAAAPVGMGQRLYRAVKWDRKPNSIQEVRYPPAALVKDFGRANHPGISMFYGAAHPSTPYQELNLKSDDKFAFSIWKIVQPFITFDLGRIYAKELDLDDGVKGGKFAPMNGGSKRFFRAMGEEFLKEVAIGNEAQYLISSTLTKVLLNNFTADKSKIATPKGEAVKQFGGVSYPSLCSKHFRENITLLPSIADHCLLLEEVHYAQCIGYSSDQSHISLLAIDKATLNSDGSLNWLNLKPREQEILIERPVDPTELKGRWNAKGTPFNSRGISTKK